MKGLTRSSSGTVSDLLHQASPALAATRLAWALALVLAGSVCTPARDAPTARAIAESPASALGLPVRQFGTHWLLREAGGWQESYSIIYGGTPADPAFAAVRVGWFHSADAAQRAFTRLTPVYLYRLWYDRMTELPRETVYPLLLPGDTVMVLAYGVRLPPEAASTRLEGQLTLVRAARAVIVVDSIGVPPERLAPAITAMTRAARGLAAP
ncbi:MAG: hypothetical protein C4290_09045 [Chloroflexota bacterium]